LQTKRKNKETLPLVHFFLQQLANPLSELVKVVREKKKEQEKVDPTAKPMTFNPNSTQ
jgi:hypothetical protein